MQPYLLILLDLLFKSSAVLMVGASALSILRRSSAANRTALCLAVFAALLLLPFTEWMTPKWSVAVVAPAAPEVRVRLPLAAAAPRERDTVSGVTAQGAAPMSAPGLRVSWQGGILLAWAGGALLLLLRRGLIGWRLAHLVRGSSPLGDLRLAASVRDMVQRSGIAAEVRESASCPVPIAAGLFRPLVLLPADAKGWDASLLHSAMRHELGHLRQRDCATRLLVDLVAAFYWPNPLVWLALRQMRLLQEQACDDLVLNGGASPQEYAAQLVDFVRSLQVGSPVASHALAMAQPSTLEQRVRAIVDHGRDRRGRSRSAVMISGVFVATVIAVCSGAQLRSAEVPKADPAKAPQPDSRQVEIEAKFIELGGDRASLPDALNDANLRRAVSILSPEKAEALIKELNSRKQTDLLSAPRVITRSGQRAVVEVVRELKYTTAWKKDAATGAWLPAASGVKNLGVIFEASPETGADGTIRLEIKPEVVELEGFRDLDGPVGKNLFPTGASQRFSEGLAAGTQTPSAPPGHRVEPIFRTRKMSLSVVLPSRSTALIPDLLLGANPGEQGKSQSRVVVMVTAQIVDAAGVPEAAARPGAGNEKLTILSDEVISDAKSGSIRASGNVKVETPAGTITADAITVTPKNPGTQTPAARPPEERGGDIIFPKMEFREATLSEIADFVTQKSKELDPTKRGVRVVIQNRDKLNEGRITLSLSNIPLRELLRYVALLAGGELSDDGYAFTIKLAAGPEPKGAVEAAGGKAAQ